MRDSRLSDIAEIIMGQSPSGEASNQSGEGVPLLNGPTEFDSHHPRPVQFTTDPRKLAMPGDLLFCVRGSTTGRMNWADQEYAIGRGVAAIRHRTSRELQPLLRGIIEIQLPTLLQAATGSTFPNVSARQLANLTVPELTEEQMLWTADLLGNLDDKIELNRQINETLETMARAIFKDWFVDFGPTRAKAEGRTPYLAPELWDLFPDALDEEDKPAGWQDDVLGLFTNLQNGYAFKSKDWRDSGVPVVKIGSVKPAFVDLDQVSFVDEALALEKTNFRLSTGDMLVGLTGYVGETGRIPPTQYTPMLNQRVGRFLPKPGLEPFVFSSVRRPEFKEFAESKSHGSAQANVSTKDLLTYPLPNPGELIIKSFCDTASPLFKSSLANSGQTSILAQTRDFLLPKLMSGEIRLTEAEKAVEAVA